MNGRDRRAQDILPRDGQPRWRVLGVGETRQYPQNAIASLRFHIQSPSGSVPFFAGTGWFVAPALVVTAAHVLDVTNAWNRVPNATQWDLEVIPGIVNGDRPFGSFRANHVEVHPGYRASGLLSSHDIALVSCSETAFGPGDCLKLAANAVENADRVRLSGYPFVVDRGGTPVEGEGPVDAVEGDHVFYDIDVEDGESGSPILGPSPERGVVGIHLGGTGHGASSIARTRNVGLRMRDDLAQWIAQFV